MKRKQFSEEQIIGILKEAEAGAVVTELCRKHGMSSATYYAWKAKYGGLEVPSAGSFGEEFRHDRGSALTNAYKTARTVGAMLDDVGITVNCAPMLDVRYPGAHDIVGDRSFSDDADAVAALGSATLRGLRSGGVEGVIKHIPGHGRAVADSHRELPVVDVPYDDLDRVDFAPFRALAAEARMAMTAHIVYRSVDPDHPATQSSIVIDRVIRGACGFDGLLMTDAIEMQALRGGPAERAAQSIQAGCDIVLCCGASLDAMAEIAAALPPMSARAGERLQQAMTRA